MLAFKQGIVQFYCFEPSSDTNSMKDGYRVPRVFIAVRIGAWNDEPIIGIEQDRDFCIVSVPVDQLSIKSLNWLNS